MSVTREVKLSNMDLALMEQTARELGFEIERNVATQLYYEKSKKKADLVIKVPGRRYNIGFRNETDGNTSVEFDHMIEKDYGKVMGKYFETLAERRTRNAMYQVRSKERVNGKLRIVFSNRRG